MNDLIILESISKHGVTGTGLIEKISTLCKNKGIPAISKPTRYGALTRLERNNYIFKQRDLTNLRRHIYTITEKGIRHRTWLRKRPTA